MNTRNYDREEVINKLFRKGLRPKPNARNIKHFEKNKTNKNVGLQTLGMVDFLGVKIKTVERKFRKQNKKRFVKKCEVCNRREMVLDRFYEDTNILICESKVCDRRWRDKVGLTEVVEYIKEG